MALIPPNEEHQQKFMEFRIKNNFRPEDINVIQEWLKFQPHLPQPLDTKLIERFLIGSKYKLEKAKTAIDVYYTTRTSIPELFTMRDPFRKEFIEATTYDAINPLPKLDQDGYRIFYGYLGAENPGLSSVFEFWKYFFMNMDILLCEDTCIGYIAVFDCIGMTMEHVKKLAAVGIPTLKRFVTCAVKGYPMPLKGLIYVNCPPVIDLVLALLTPLLPKKIQERIKVFTKNSPKEEIYKHISKDLLPSTLGGTACTLEESRKYWKMKVKEYRNWFIEQENVKSNESKRIGKFRYASEFETYEGTFKKLNFD